jgi:hypothetical protein
MWILILLAVHINNPNDVPGIIKIEFNELKECERAAASLQYWLKFESFKITAQCQKKS